MKYEIDSVHHILTMSKVQHLAFVFFSVYNLLIMRLIFYLMLWIPLGQSRLSLGQSRLSLGQSRLSLGLRHSSKIKIVATY